MKISKTSIANFSKSNFFIPSLVILLVIVGWFFLLTIDFAEEDDSDSVSWSQKEDYIIEETSEGIFVKNEKAGLSFKVPDGWRVEMKNDNTEDLINEFWITLLSSDAEVGTNNLLTKGCGLSVWVEFQEKQFEYIKNEMETIRQNPENYKINENFQKEIIKIDNHFAIKWIGKSDKTEIYEKIGQVIEIKIPVDNKIIYIDARVLPSYQEECFRTTNDFLKTILIE